MKRLLAAFLAAVAAAAPFAGMAEQEWYHVQELREATRDGWHQTYETPWRTVRVDVDIEVPDVEAFPMIRVRKMQPVDVTKLNFENLDVRVNVAGDFYAVEGAFPQSSAKSADFKSILDFGDSVPDCLPENNGTTYQEALDVIDKALCALCGRGLADVYIKQTRVVSRYYKYKVVDGERVWLDPVNDRGFYQFDGRQLFHGIPDEYCGNYTTDGKAPAFGDIGVSVADGDTWGFHLGWLNETGVLYDDVPILSFEKAKAAYEELIEKGLVRDVLEARLCYTSYIDPDDSDVFYLLPVWYARCVYAKKADTEFPTFTDPNTGEVYTDNPQYEELVFEAQKGTLMDWDDSRRDRRDVPEIVTWDQVE